MEKILVIVTHHDPKNAKYLRVVVDRLLRQEGRGIEFCLDINVVSTEYQSYGKDLMETHDIRFHFQDFFAHPDLSNATKKGNWAIENIMEYFHDRVLFCSDDVYPALNAIKTMLEEPKNTIVNIMSNSDIGGLVRFPLSIPNSLSLEDLPEEHVKALDGPTPGLPLTVLVPMVPFFFTMLGREVIESVGYLNNDLDAAGNDMEYCHRARAKGVPVVLSFKSLVIHFNGKTLKHTTTEEQRMLSMSDAHAEIYGRFILRKGIRKECQSSPQTTESKT